MSKRIVIDVSEDDLAAIAKDELLALAFVNAVYGIKEKHKLEEGTTISTSTDVRVNGNISRNYENVRDYDFSFGFGRYRQDQGDVVIEGVNGSKGRCPVQEAKPKQQIK